MVENGLLAALRDRLKSEIAYAIYVKNGTEHRTAAASAAVLSDGRVSCSFLLSTASDTRETVTEIRVYNAADVLLAKNNVSITNSLGVSGIYYRFFFTVKGE